MTLGRASFFLQYLIMQNDPFNYLDGVIVGEGTHIASVKFFLAKSIFFKLPTLLLNSAVYFLKERDIEVFFHSYEKKINGTFVFSEQIFLSFFLEINDRKLSRLLEQVNAKKKIKTFSRPSKYLQS